MPTARLPSPLTLEVGLDEPDDLPALRSRVAKKYSVAESELPVLAVRKRSLDCRAGRVRYHYLLQAVEPELTVPNQGQADGQLPKEVGNNLPVVIVGDGPCGLLCAYQLARLGIASVVLDRGREVQPRRKDLKGLTRHGSVDPNSNYCFGEGGAGTYSDGKLYTRAHKRGDIRDVLEILALHGAPEEILIDARPHIGSNRLPKVITALRERLQNCGVQFRFGAQMTAIVTTGEGSDRHVCGVELADGSTLQAQALVLATGHSAHDVYELLHANGHPLEAKAFALGVRIEHPQPLINEIQYGKACGHPKLPSAAYRLVDSRAERAVFSFCMCPGGFIVPATTQPGHVVVNGMSPSQRNSRYANSGLVRAVEPEDWVSQGFEGPLGGLALQRHLEAAAFHAGGGSLAAPAVRVPDFLAGRSSSTLPSSSYVPGLVAADVGEVLDSAGLPIAEALRQALKRFDRNLRGYVSEEAVLVGVETRTSSPVRIPRQNDTLQSTVWRGLYPGGEGAGYAGGIMSAAVDGIRIARNIASSIAPALHTG